MQNGLLRLKNKRALITGGGKGIGAGIARAFVREGAHVCINTLEDVKCHQSLLEELNNCDVMANGRAFALQADIREQMQIRKMLGAAAQEMGGIDILVNNAGVESVENACDLSIGEWDRICNTNLRGVFICSQTVAELMRSQPQGGTIVNISSIHDTIPRLGVAHYCAAKAGVTMLTKSLALEWAEYRIRVVGIAPGAIETEINRDEINQVGRERFEHWIPLGRLGSPADIAAATVFLASDEASYISGTTLTVDGAYSLNSIRYDPRKKIGEPDETSR